MLKQLLFISTFIGVSASAFADDLRATAISEAGNAQKVTASVKETIEDSVRWKFPCNLSLSFTQAGFNNSWVGGGTNNISYNANANLNANYARDRHVWTNNLFMEYGGLFARDMEVAPFYERYRKTVDRLEFNSKYGYQSSKVKSLYYSALFDFKTQMSRGYEFNEDNKKQVSSFLTPAKAVLALGMDYKPNKYVSVFLSPLTGRFVGVADRFGDMSFVVEKEDSLGVRQEVEEVEDLEENDLRKTYGTGHNYINSSLGAYLRIVNDFDIVENIHLKSNLDFFSPYTKWAYRDIKVKDDQGIEKDKYEHKHYFLTRAVVNWDLLLSMRITKYITSSIHTNYIYDPNIAYAESNLRKSDKHFGEHAGGQFMYQYCIGFAYNF